MPELCLSYARGFTSGWNPTIDFVKCTRQSTRVVVIPQTKAKLQNIQLSLKGHAEEKSTKTTLTCKFAITPQVGLPWLCLGYALAMPELCPG